jgi:glutamyl/glutaminyl-tRNA synthetase
MTYQERFDELMQDGTEYCCYCGTERINRVACCGEVHFETFAQMDKDNQQYFMDCEDLDD